MSKQESYKDFIREHAGEISPFLDASEKEIFENLETQPPENLETILEEYESKLFYSEKRPDQYNKDAKRVLLTANDPGAYNVIRLLISALEKDPRCKGVTFLGSGVGGKNFQTEFSKDFMQVHSRKLLIEDILEVIEERPIDIVVASVSSKNGPESLALLGGKTNLGARKTFLIADGWSSLGSQFDRNSNVSSMDKIDAIFCPDVTAKKIYEHQLPNVSPDLFLPMGTPVIDELKVKNSPEFTRKAREKFGIDKDTRAIFYAGDISFEAHQAYDVSDRINEKTFEETLNALITLAKTLSDNKFCLLVRPHPRDPNHAELFSIISGRMLPDNLQIVSATKEEASIQEVRYAADVVVSIGSTENFFAPNLGRSTIFLGYTHQPGLGGAVLDRIYGQKLIRTIKASSHKINIATTPEEMAEIIANSPRAPEDVSKLPITQSGNTTERMLDKIFEA